MTRRGVRFSVLAMILLATACSHGGSCDKSSTSGALGRISRGALSAASMAGGAVGGTAGHVAGMSLRGLSAIAGLDDRPGGGLHGRGEDRDDPSPCELPEESPNDATPEAHVEPSQIKFSSG